LTHDRPPVDIAGGVAAPFWLAAAEGRLAIQRCRTCGSYHHPPVDICPECVSLDLVFEEVSGHGTVAAFTITGAGGLASSESFVIAVVCLDEDPALRLLSNLPGVPVERIQPGLRVRLASPSAVTPFVAQFTSIDDR
jgi:uncharacterized protein